MIEVVGDLWAYQPIEPEAMVRCVTTNGFVKNDGSAVMGAGCAKEAAEMHPWLPGWLGAHIQRFGNHVFACERADGNLAFVPVKHHWREKADMPLILQSVRELVVIATALGYDVVVLPRPGCGNGGLQWGHVKPAIERHLDDRFHIISKG